jgi:hypothetical protein
MKINLTLSRLRPAAAHARQLKRKPDELPFLPPITSSSSPTAASCFVDIDILKYYVSSMKVTVEVSEEELKDILRATREKRKGAAIRQLALEALMLKKRRELLDEVEAGKWSVDLPPIERLREDRNLWRS